MMNEMEFILQDRLNVIKDTINKYGEDKFYLSFSGGKDSTVVHHLLDMAIPNNKIPRVFSNTGIEYNAVVEFVRQLANKDDRFDIIYPKQNIKLMLEEVGYPFKSKEHSAKLSQYKRGLRNKSILDYKDGNSIYSCPQKLLYQYENEFNLKISENCCRELKKTPFHLWEAKTKRRIAITGMRVSEGGERVNLNCISYRNGRIRKFHPLVKVTDDWEDWFIKQYNIDLCKLYLPPFNFSRTGCKGCPFNINLDKELKILERYFPNERKQCEYIWKPIYEEYRKIGYRLSNNKRRLFKPW